MSRYYLNRCFETIISTRWRSGASGRASDLQLIGCGFESCLGTIAQWPWASYLHLCASVTKQYKLVPVKGRLPCDWGVQTKLWSVCGWQVKL